MSNHFITKCSNCDKIINQCRCPGPKTLRLQVCAECATKLENGQSNPCSSASAGSTTPVWGARKCDNGDYQLLYPGYSAFFDNEVQISAGVSRETMEKLAKEIKEALS